MIALLLVLASETILQHSLIQVPPSHWTAVQLRVAEHETTVECRFKVVKGSRVQIYIADREEAERFHHGRSFAPVFASGFESEGHFRTIVHEAGDYVLLLDNRIDARGGAVVEVTLEETRPPAFHAQELPPPRRQAVVALSLLFFGAVIVFSARQFLKHT
jgi:hypothetical protein